MREIENKNAGKWCQQQGCCLIYTIDVQGRVRSKACSILSLQDKSYLRIDTSSECVCRYCEAFDKSVVALGIFLFLSFCLLKEEAQIFKVIKIRDTRWITRVNTRDVLMVLELGNWCVSVLEHHFKTYPFCANHHWHSFFWCAHCRLCFHSRQINFVVFDSSLPSQPEARPPRHLSTSYPNKNFHHLFLVTSGGWVILPFVLKYSTVSKRKIF